MCNSSNHSTLDIESFLQGIFELAQQDPDLAQVVSRWGNPPFWTHTAGFPGLVLDILSQQVSLESAQAAFTKLENKAGVVSPEAFLQLDNDAMREIGFSRQKASYVRGIAGKVQSGEFDFQELESLDDHRVRERLIAFKGVGGWTADTYLLFSLRRPDAWPSGDLALVKAIHEVKGLAAVPGPEEVNRIAERWKPWRAVAARILWHHYLNERGRMF